MQHTNTNTNTITDRAVFLGVDELETLDAPIIDPFPPACLTDHEWFVCQPSDNFDHPWFATHDQGVTARDGWPEHIGHLFNTLQPGAVS